jgi:hypothetical protein
MSALVAELVQRYARSLEQSSLRYDIRSYDHVGKRKTKLNYETSSRIDYAGEGGL